ncbi:glycine zipper 2TM domain-containing protein [Azospirillum sp.]|uniref:glycine zipper 2TM domain-containing protein n=1 Tax=Azospirillum sp. TaxID=34012 RepID=UPI002D3638CE|nr:glycine zipper 2TM domain-containing protein [Azospirillum sp.]HYF86773.1 glycine zipper 2TM domain-containing protein [Azospirillum sp.]
MLRSVSLCLFVAVAGGLAGCTSDYSPNTYSSSAVQQANKVEPAVVVGFRQVAISANGTVGAVSGGAAGGILGAQVGSGGMNAALGTVGGTAIGGLLGTAMEHIAGDTTGWEYIVRKSNGDLLSLTQKEPQPLPIGQKVLVITGSQARIVPDYSSPAESATAKADSAQPNSARTDAAAEPPKPETPKSDIKAVPLAPPAAPAPSESAAGPAPSSGGGPIRLTAPTDNVPAPAASTPSAAPVPAEEKPAE